MEHALASYVRASLLSLIIGASSGLGLWILGMVGLCRRAQVRAPLRRVGRRHRADPVHRAVARRYPAGPVRARPAPLSALRVVLLFLGIQQLEGHVVVPKVMGHSLRLHPLLVIFGLLAGGEIYGFPGILVALPLLAAGVPRGSSSPSGSSSRRGRRMRRRPRSGRAGDAAGSAAASGANRLSAARLEVVGDGGAILVQCRPPSAVREFGSRCREPSVASTASS